MAATSTGYRAAAVLGTAVAALALVLPGCSSGQPSNGPQAGVDESSPAKPSAGQEKPDGQLDQPLLRSLDDALDKIDAEDAEQMDVDKRQARGTLLEADQILTRIKAENRRGLKRANTPPRRVVPHPAPAEPETPPEPEPPVAEPAPAPE